MFCDWPVKSLLLPLFNVLEIVFFMERSIGDESVFVSKDELFIINVDSLEAQILEFWFYWTVLVKISINSSDSTFIWAIKITDGLPNLSLYFQIVFEIVNYCVVFFYLGLFMILIKFGVNIFG